MKLLIKEDDYIQSNMVGRNMTHKMGSPFENLRSLTKQILQFLSQTKKCNVDQLLLPKEILATLEIFHIPNFRNSSRNKALVVSSIREYQQYETLHQLHLGHWYQQNHDSFYRWISSIRSWLNWIWCDHQKARSK